VTAAVKCEEMRAFSSLLPRRLTAVLTGRADRFDLPLAFAV
jgi:hypothetical protein